MGTRRNRGSKTPQTDDSAFQEFEVAARLEVPLPADAHVVGEPVTVTKICYTGYPRIGLLATCRRGERAYEVSFANIVFSPGSGGADLVARYRAWLGFDAAAGPETSPEPARAHKVASDDIVVGKPVELVVLACKSNALRCRLLGTAREVTLRTAVRDEVPGSIITVTPTKHWTHARHPYVSGEVVAMRIEVGALGLVPLELRDQGEWDPVEEYWGEKNEPVPEWAKPMIARGSRPVFEMEQALPGVDPDDFDSDPIVEASERRAAGDWRGADDILMNLLAKDFRCLDAHAHLGNFVFDHRPMDALRHYEMGAAIGALSLGEDFDGVLSWGLIDNRPYLRCLHGVGLCLWRLGKRHEAADVFRKMLWLNPGDNQGARFNLASVEAGETWDEMEGD